MINKLLPVFYLPPIAWFAEFLNTNSPIVFEKHEHFPKQTYRNRANIYGANGKLALIIPISHKGRCTVEEVEISYSEDWQAQHWKSIKTAYQSSAYFEYYETSLSEIYSNKEKYLINFNLNAIKIIQKILKKEQCFIFSEEYIKQPKERDFRNEFSTKLELNKNFESYFQVFSDKYGFLPNLSILDLICNKGSESLTYISKIK